MATSDAIFMVAILSLMMFKIIIMMWLHKVNFVQNPLCSRAKKQTDRRRYRISADVFLNVSPIQTAPGRKITNHSTYYYSQELSSGFREIARVLFSEPQARVFEPQVRKVELWLGNPSRQLKFNLN